MDTTVDRVRSKSKEDKNFAPKQNERDCPMTGQKTSDAHFTRISEVPLCLLALFWLYFSDGVLFSE